MTQEQKTIEGLFSPVGSQQSVTSQDLKEVIQGVFDVNNINLRTNLTQQQIFAIIRATVFAQEFNCPYVLDIIEELKQLQISQYALGRRDMRAAFAAILSRYGVDMQEQRKQGLVSRFFKR